MADDALNYDKRKDGPNNDIFSFIYQNDEQAQNTYNTNGRDSFNKNGFKVIPPGFNTKF